MRAYLIILIVLSYYLIDLFDTGTLTIINIPLILICVILLTSKLVRKLIEIVLLQQIEQGNLEIRRNQRSTTPNREEIRETLENIQEELHKSKENVKLIEMIFKDNYCVELDTIYTGATSCTFVVKGYSNFYYEWDIDSHVVKFFNTEIRTKKLDHHWLEKNIDFFMKYLKN